jgi:transcriptional regulator with XRE-family HTH domain
MGELIGTAQAHELGSELRRIRDAAGLRGQDLADRLGWSVTKLSRVESGLRGITALDVVRYGAHCGVDADRIDGLVELCREPGAPGYWLTQRLHTLVFHETVAAFSASYDPLVIPGLLQTEEYATALIGENRQGLIRGRMERQRVLQNRPFEFYIHEQALRLPVGGGRVMNEQLLKLVLVATQPRITIRVIPTVLGEQAALGAPFLLFRYENHRPLVYLEHGPVGLFVEDVDHVDKFQDKLARLSDVALGRGQSREFLATLASEFDRPEDSHHAPDVAEEQLQ